MNNFDKILKFLRDGLDKRCFDALLIPVRVPAGDSYAWVLIKDISLIKDASPLPPIMGVQGAKALSSVTKNGGRKKIAAVMRPCEIRAAVELSKLEQVNLTNVVLISVDCPGVLPIKEWFENPGKGEEIFKKVLNEWQSEYVRPVCQICYRFSMKDTFSDIHIGIIGEKVLFIPNTSKGEKILSKLDIEAPMEKDVSGWKDKVEEIIKEKRNKRKQAQDELKTKVVGLNKLLDVFNECINCHNCMRVCPICYCRQCYFSSEKTKYPPEDYFARAKEKGALRFPPDSLLFHIGRMSHMSFSCVSCGACEDACPVSIPVAQVFSLVAEKTQGLFDYVPGSINEPIPLATYKEEELKEMEYSPKKEEVNV
ncbi:MAG: hypothetical protein B5M53_00240 [Candidatus Cloacimonas sp. 4484_209]|nr:MAG: hypothetical protein B5M53_00240 [Candidatus Cloacimonas sp. 4484_209]